MILKTATTVFLPTLVALHCTPISDSVTGQSFKGLLAFYESLLCQYRRTHDSHKNRFQTKYIFTIYCWRCRSSNFSVRIISFLFDNHFTKWISNSSSTRYLCGRCQRFEVCLICFAKDTAQVLSTQPTSPTFVLLRNMKSHFQDTRPGKQSLKSEALHELHNNPCD